MASTSGQDDDDEAMLITLYVAALQALRMTGPDSNLVTKTQDLKEAVNVGLPASAQLRTRGGKPSAHSRSQEIAFSAAVSRVFGTDLVQSSQHLTKASHLLGYALEPVAVTVAGRWPSAAP